MRSADSVLFIPELLDIVFRFLDKDANVANACVCKRWSDIALDVVWKDVDDILRLFRLLNPIVVNEALLNRYSFRTLPDANDWSRFEKYASRVRSLKFRTTYQFNICPLLDDVARTRTSLEILPNMHTLEYVCTGYDLMERCKLFLHRRLRRLAVTCPTKLTPNFYADMCARAPHLRVLTLYVPYPGKPIDTELGIMLENLPELEHIVLPEFHYTSSIIEQLSQAKSISVIDFDQDLRLGYGNPDNVASFNPVLKPGAFPCLRELTLSVRIDDLDRFFHSNYAPAHLGTLYINAYTQHTPAQVHALLTLLAQQCHHLVKFNLQLYDRDLPSHLSPDDQLSYDTLKPVLAFSHLTTFELVHKYPLRITCDQIDDLARQWPHVESLMLNAEPLFLNEDAISLDLGAYLPFAQRCPSLRVLGLYVDASSCSIPAHDLLPSFTHLHTLAIGTSHVGDTIPVATFLSRICPSGCTFEMGITWTEFGTQEQRALSPHLRQALQKRCAGWREVERVLPALIELRREEEARSRALRVENEDLRTRNQLLMDRAESGTRDSCVVA